MLTIEVSSAGEIIPIQLKHKLQMAILTIARSRRAGFTVDSTRDRTISDIEGTKLSSRDERCIHILNIVVARIRRHSVRDQRLDSDSSHARVWKEVVATEERVAG